MKVEAQAFVVGQKPQPRPGELGVLGWDGAEGLPMLWGPQVLFFGELDRLLLP